MENNNEIKAVHQSNVSAGFFSSSKKTYSIGIGIVIIVVCVALGYFTYTSMPGNILYKAKIEVIENALSVTKVTQQQQFDYSITLLENRLEELKALSVRNELTQEKLDEFDMQFEVHIQNIDQLLIRKDTIFSAQEIFDTTNHMLSIVKAAEQIMDNTPMGDSDRFETIDDTATAIHEAQIERIVAQSTPEEMVTIIQSKLTLITQQLDVQNQNTKALVRDYLIDASEALSEQDFGLALQAVSNAMQLLEVRSQVNQTQG